MKRLSFQNAILSTGILALLVLCGGSSGYGASIQLSIAMPVTNQSVTITVPGLGNGGIINIADSHGGTTQLLANAQSRVVWTPTRYGKYTVSSGTATQTLWATTRPMTFHWWDCTTVQTNVTVVMQRNSAWQARGVKQVDWTGGEVYSRGGDGHYWTNAVEWTNGWSYAYSAGGMAIDELFCDAGFPADPILQAIAMVRQARGTNYSINLWSAGISTNFAVGAAVLKSNNVTILIEDYYGTWDLHSSRWATVRSYGLQNQAISGIWPGTAPLTNEAAVRADMALVRLVAPEANGIAIFAPVTNNFIPAVWSSVLNACDQAIEDYFLKPVIHLTVNASSQLVAWNLGNDDATGFSLEFLNGTGGVVQTVNLSGLTPNGKLPLTIPGGAVSARVVNPAGTANLYTGNSKYSNGLYPVNVPGRYTWINANGNNLWSAASNWSPSGPPPGNIDSGNGAYFDGAVLAPHTLTAASGETSINSIQFVTGGWTIAGNATTQDFYTYGISSAGAGTNTINIGISARDVVPAWFNIDAGNTLVLNGLVGAVRNNGGLIKNGAGTLVLTYANNYTGGTTVNQGVLLVRGSLASGSAVLVNNNGVLGGVGMINGTVTVNNGGTLTVGMETDASAVVGMLTLGSSPVLSAGSTNYLRITKTGGTVVSDKISVGAGAISYAGTLVVTNITSDLQQLANGDTFKLFAAGGYGGVFAASNLPPLASDFIWDTTKLVVDGSITVRLAPTEASTNDALANLAFTPAGALSPGFAAGTTNYTAVNPFANNPVRVMATSVAPNATLALSLNNGPFVPLTNGVASGPQTLKLAPPLNIVAIKVTAQDQSQARIYTVAVTQQPSQTAPILTYSVNGNMLTLNWPADCTGYRLEVQTNYLTDGISGNTNDWMTVAGTTTNNAVTLPMDVLSRCNFYRLVYP